MAKRYGLAIGAGLAAAVAGGIVWGLIVKWSDYEIGIVAWAIGFAAGTAVAAASAGRKGLPLQAIAIVSALVGILIGKYLSFALVVQEAAASEGADVGLFGSNMRGIFRDELGTVFSPWDLLWTGLAVVTAWRILQPEQAAPEPPDA